MDPAVRVGLPYGLQLSSAALRERPCDQQIRVLYLLPPWTLPAPPLLEDSCPFPQRGFRETWEIPTLFLLVLPGFLGQAQCDKVSLLPGGSHLGWVPAPEVMDPGH